MSAATLQAFRSRVGLVISLCLAMAATAVLQLGLLPEPVDAPLPLPAMVFRELHKLAEVSTFGGIVTVAGKRSNKTLPLTSTTPTPIKTDASKAKMQRSARISWAAHPAKCLDLRAGGISNGNVLQLWDCRNGSKDMLFLIPDDGSVGKIKLKSNPEFCMDASGRMGTTLMIWHCEQAKIEHMLFKMPNRSRGLIRLARSPTKCIDVPGGKADNGHRLQLWWCEDRHLDHMTFNIIDSP